MENQANINKREASSETPPTLGIARRYKKRVLEAAKVVKEYFVTFKLEEEPSDDDFSLYVLKIDKENDLPETKTGQESNVDESPLACLLKQWKVEIRERPTGMKDKLYSHSHSSRTLRSLVEVAEFIQKKYDPNFEKLEIRAERSEKGSSLKSGKNKSFGGTAKTSFHVPKVKNDVEKFLAEAHKNLMKMSPPTMDHEKGTMEELDVVEFLREAYDNLLNYKPPKSSC